MATPAPKKRKLAISKEANDDKIVSQSANASSSSSSSSSSYRFRVLITVKLPPVVSKYLKDLCYQAVQQGVYIDVASWEKDAPMPKERLKSMLSANEYHAILCTLNDGITREILDLAPNLKVVSTMSVGYDHIDGKACYEKGIRIGHTPGVLTDTSADLAVALLLAVARRIPEAADSVRNGEWLPWAPLWMCGRDVHHSTVGIVGLGRIGSAIAKRLRGFECKIIYCGPRPKPAVAAVLDATYVTFDELLKQSDSVIVACSLNESTFHLFNEAAFAKMKSDALFINTARGGIVDQAALLVALKNGVIAGCALDVTDPEPMDNTDPLLELPNCLIVPHIASASVATRIRMGTTAVDNMVAGLFVVTAATPVNTPTNSDTSLGERSFSESKDSHSSSAVSPLPSRSLSSSPPPPPELIADPPDLKHKRSVDHHSSSSSSSLSSSSSSSSSKVVVSSTSPSLSSSSSSSSSSSVFSSPSPGSLSPGAHRRSRSLSPPLLSSPSSPTRYSHSVPSQSPSSPLATATLSPASAVSDLEVFPTTSSSRHSAFSPSHSPLPPTRVPASNHAAHSNVLSVSITPAGRWAPPKGLFVQYHPSKHTEAVL